MTRPVTPEEVETFWADGVVCLRGVLPASLLADLEEPVDVALTREESADLTSMGRSLVASGHPVPTDPGVGGGRFVSGVDHWRHQPELRDFALASPLPALVGMLLRSSVVRLYEDSVLVKEPGALEHTAWHQDLGYFHVDGDQLCTTWCPLDPVTVATGAMVFARGSHRWGATFRPNLFVSPTPIPGTVGETVPDVDALAAAGEVELLTFALEPGDVTVHHARTLHAAGGNRSAATRRRAISVRYCGDDARVLVRPGAPLKPSLRGLTDAMVLPDDEFPVAWTERAEDRPW